MQLIDLSQVIEPGMPLFGPGAPQPRVWAWMSHADAARSGSYQGCTCEVSQVQMVTSCGTYLDSPYHFFPDKPAVHELELSRLVLPGLRIDCTQVGAAQPIGPQLLAGMDVAGKAVLFHTGWSRYWRCPDRYRQFPYLTGETAQALVDGGAALVGVDCLVVDDLGDPRRPAHVTLLGAEVLIVENLTNLDRLPDRGFTFHGAPVKVAGAAAFPVRAYGVVA